MRFFISLVLVSQFLIHFSANAEKFKTEWTTITYFSGFFGRIALGAAAKTSPRNVYTLSLGTYPLNQTYLFQFNGEWIHYFKLLSEEKSEGSVFSGGIFYLQNLDLTRGFFSTSDPYPESGYYDANISRAGTSLSWGYQWKNPQFVEFRVSFNILSQGWIAYFNNVPKPMPYFFSPGISLRMDWPFRKPESKSPSLELAPSSL